MTDNRRILLLNGSPKTERSNTLRVAKAFLSGFPESASVERIDLYRSDIQPCRGCFSCWGSSAGHCVIPDDMEKNIAAVRRSDIIILSFPLYFFGMPSQVKAFLDRCLPLMKPYQGNASDSRPSFHTLRDESLKEKHFVVISSCGFVSAEEQYQPLKKQLDLLLGSEKYTTLFCPEGELFVVPQPVRQRERYLEDIKKAGAEFSEHLLLTEQTKKKIAMPMLSPRGFEAVTAEHWLSLH